MEGASRPAVTLSLLCVAVIVAIAAPLHGQELEPRSYAPAPTGTTFIIAGFGRSQGPILLDPSLDVDHVEGDLWVATVGIGCVFSLAGRQTRVLAVLPVARGAVEGEVSGQAEQQGLGGLVDPRIKVTVGLYGAPALTRVACARTRRASTSLGASLTVTPPWGEYRATRLVNLGFHRWAFKPEVGVSHVVGRWTLDGYGGVWFFTTNDAYFPGGALRQQDAIVAWQTHVSYSLPHRTWLAFNGTWFSGGQTRVDGIVNPDLQRNSRLGATLSVPLSGPHSLKFVYSTGATTRRGSDFNTFNVTWQLVALR